jgi:hypothetical protein
MDVPAHQATKAGGPIRQPYARVNYMYIPQLGTMNLTTDPFRFNFTAKLSKSKLNGIAFNSQHLCVKYVHRISTILRVLWIAQVVTSVVLAQGRERNPPPSLLPPPHPASYSCEIALWQTVSQTVSFASVANY